jgi:hypothetical protein
MKTPLVSIRALTPACLMLAGCVTDGTSPGTGIGDTGFVPIPPRGGVVVGNVLDYGQGSTGTFTDRGTRCVTGRPNSYKEGGSENRTYSANVSGGLSVTFTQLLSGSLNAKCPTQNRIDRIRHAPLA